MNANTDKQRSFLFIFSRGPHSNLKAKEGLDFAFAAAAFGQAVSVLFIGEGVFQLKTEQNTNAIATKNHSSGLEALSLYGVEQVFIAEADLAANGLAQDDLIEAGTPLTNGEIETLINQQDFIFNY